MKIFHQLILIVAFAYAVMTTFLLYVSTVGYPAQSQQLPGVDAAIVFMVDESNSISDKDKALQRAAHMDAIQSPEFMRAVKRGYFKTVAVSYTVFDDTVKRVVPWHPIRNEVDAARFARLISRYEHLNGNTNLHQALSDAALQFSAMPFRPVKMIVDITGDGMRSDGKHPDEIRDKLVAMGVVINALIFDATPATEEYFANRVVGGNGHFIKSIKSATQMRDALRRKLILEMI